MLWSHHPQSGRFKLDILLQSYKKGLVRGYNNIHCLLVRKGLAGRVMLWLHFYHKPRLWFPFKLVGIQQKSLQKQFYDAVIILSCSYSLCDYDHHRLQAAEKGFVQHHLLELLLEERQDFDYLFHFIVLKSMFFYQKFRFLPKFFFPARPFKIFHLTKPVKLKYKSL